MNIEEIYEIAEEMLSSKVAVMTKIEVKCWVYHSESRLRYGYKPFTFENYSHSLDICVPLDYIKFDLIDVSDLGGKEVAVDVINRWYK